MLKCEICGQAKEDMTVDANGGVYCGEMNQQERNARVQKRYDELMREGKHGHYETLFRVVREEIEREREGK